MLNRQFILKARVRHISRWLKEEDEKLLNLHEEYGPSWSFIALKNPGRSPTECRRRYFKLVGELEGPESSKDDDKMIRDGWERAPSGDWVRIPLDEIGPSPTSMLAALVPRFQHRWERLAGWLPQEKMVVIEGFFEFGADWAKIAEKLPRRTPDQCRRLYEKLFILHADSGVQSVEEMKESLFNSDDQSEKSMEVEGLVELFKKIGLDETKSQETARNKKLSKALNECVEEAGCSSTGMERSKGLLLYLLASKMPSESNNRKFIVNKVMKEDLKSDAQILAAVQYFDKSNIVNEKEFDEFCGVNVNVSDEQVKLSVSKAIEKHNDGLLQSRYEYNFGSVLKTVKDMPEMRWADRKAMKDRTDEAIVELLGPKNELDLNPEKKKNLASPNPASQPADATRRFEGVVLKLHKPGENKQLNDEIMKKHLAATGGKVITRFPPEPNGFLHIGHAKAMNFSFRYAEKYDGLCYLRYDDTNPEAEEQMYYDSIRESVRWLGFEPCQVTAASDYFQQLYEFAVELIKRGKAYVCHMTNEEIHASRGGDNQGPRYDSPWRNRPIQENLDEFERMRKGEYPEGKAILRLKMDMQNPNPCMWDLVAYRVLYTPHCRTGCAWNIYPMYDFTHCLCDSIENITHSLCTTEFINAREAYYWVCDQLEVYKAVQWEYGRLRITNTVLSKRRLTKLVSEGVVAGWDDPRIYTLAALRRRGFTPAAINRFVEELGITTALTTVDVKRLENCVRDDMNKTTPRRMVVTDPILVILENIDSNHCEMISIPNDPRDASKGEGQVPFTNQLYIDGSDFRSADDPNFFRLTPKQPVGLFKAGVMEFKREVDGVIYATIDRSEQAPKPKTFIQWVPVSAAHNSPLRAELRLYKPLFKSENPDAAPGGFLNDINPDSLTIKEGLCDPRLFDAKVEDKFQFQRVGYFCKDPDSNDSRPVFNLTVSIKEDPLKD